MYLVYRGQKIIWTLLVGYWYLYEIQLRYVGFVMGLILFFLNQFVYSVFYANIKLNQSASNLRQMRNVNNFKCF